MFENWKQAEIVELVVDICKKKTRFPKQLIFSQAKTFLFWEKWKSIGIQHLF